MPRGGARPGAGRPYAALECLYGDFRRLDLFARRERPGWTGWGNEMRQAIPLHEGEAGEAA
jgi:N6-adenosine-specific RNA methylase IME4